MQRSSLTTRFQTSAPMLLGISSLSLVTRTVVPSTGVTVAIGMSKWLHMSGIANINPVISMLCYEKSSKSDDPRVEFVEHGSREVTENTPPTRHSAAVRHNYSARPHFPSTHERSQSKVVTSITTARGTARWSRTFRSGLPVINQSPVSPSPSNGHSYSFTSQPPSALPDALGKGLVSKNRSAKNMKKDGTLIISKPILGPWKPSSQRHPAAIVDVAPARQSPRSMTMQALITDSTESKTLSRTFVPDHQLSWPIAESVPVTMPAFTNQSSLGFSSTFNSSAMPSRSTQPISSGAHKFSRQSQADDLQAEVFSGSKPELRSSSVSHNGSTSAFDPSREIVRKPMARQTVQSIDMFFGGPGEPPLVPKLSSSASEHNAPEQRSFSSEVYKATSPYLLPAKSYERRPNYKVSKPRPRDSIILDRGKELSAQVAGVRGHNGAVPRLRADRGIYRCNSTASMRSKYTSVMDRPRPISRRLAKDRSIFLEEGSSRSSVRFSQCSSSSGRSRYSLRLAGGKASPLPPLPSFPEVPRNAVRLRPNSTRSMNVDEKMEIFFVQDPGASDLQHSIRPSYEVRTSSGDSKTARSMAALFSAERTESDTVTERGDGYETKKSSLVLPADDDTSFMTSPTGSGEKQNTPGWDAHPAIAKSVHLHKAHGTEITFGKDVSSEPEDDVNTEFELSPSVVETTTDETFGEETNLKFPVNKQTSVQRGPLPDPTMDILGSPHHHRVGEGCSSFSARKATIQHRKITPPTPLVLDKSRRPAALVETKPDPAHSADAHSADKILELIQTQLRNYEQSYLGSPGDAGTRNSLLDQMEREMAIQERSWKRIKDDLGVDSPSTAEIHSNRQSGFEELAIRVGDVSAASSLSSQPSEGEGMQPNRKEPEANGSLKVSPAVHLPREQRTSWQRRFVQMQEDGTAIHDNFTAESARRLSALIINSLRREQVASPTPSNTDNSEMESISGPTTPKEFARRTSTPTLWLPLVYSVELPSPELPSLWTAPLQSITRRPELFQTRHESVRTPPKKNIAPLPIESSQLWKQSQTTKAPSLRPGLWQPTSGVVRFQIEEPVARPRSQRPPRRRKRISHLPDILECPQPLPGDGNTLGIFELPTGEVSATATKPRQTQAFLQPRGTEYFTLESQGYSPSYFDDYDDDDERECGTSSDYDMEGDSSDDDDDGDDPFDESTVWEIVTLLRPNGSPSGRSPLEEEEDALDVDPLSIAEDSITLGLAAEPVRESIPLMLDTKSLTASLWTPRQTGRKKTNWGLSPPDTLQWKRYQAHAALPSTRPKPRRHHPLSISSTTLWRRPVEEHSPQATTAQLWRGCTSGTKAVSSASNAASLHPISSGLWKPPLKLAEVAQGGLFDGSVQGRRSIHANHDAAAPVLSRPRTRVENAPPGQPSSDKMWSLSPRTSQRRNWILGSSERIA